MTHSYHISGMTCPGCVAKVQHLLSQVDHVTKVSIDLPSGIASISMNAHVATPVLQAALLDYPKYKLTDTTSSSHSMRHSGTSVDGPALPDSVFKPKDTAMGVDVNMATDVDDFAADGASHSWLMTYTPLLLIFGYILGITVLLQFSSGHFNLMLWMNHFMAGFFLVFSFFKLLNLRGFAESYAMYDIIAQKWAPWGYLYAFIELGLGLAFLLQWQPLVTNGITFAVMGISIVGVLQSVLNKRKIRCACLGAVFNLPMSSVTIIEDALMIVMSAFMLFHLL